MSELTADRLGELLRGMNANPAQRYFTFDRETTRQLVETARRAQAIAEVMREKIGLCCGNKVGATFCESYGCATLAKLADTLEGRRSDSKAS